MMSEGYYLISWAAFLSAALLLLAGFGWRRFALVVAGSLLAAACLALFVGWAIWTIFYPLQPGGDLKGMGLFGLTMVIGAGIFLVTALGGPTVIAFKRPAVLQRARFSWVLMTLGGLFAIGGVTARHLNRPENASEHDLARKIELDGWNPVLKSEMVRRGQAAVPELIARLHDLRRPERKYEVPSRAPPLLQTLGEIGGPEAIRELHDWAAADVYPRARSEALTQLSIQGDRSIIPLLVKCLNETDLNWSFEQARLIQALARLKAVDQIDLMRKVIEKPNPSSNLIFEGLPALASMGTDASWSAVGKIVSQSKSYERGNMLSALEKVRSPRTISFLAEYLDDPDRVVQEAAYWSIVRQEPQLAEGLPRPWNTTNAENLLERVRRRNPGP